MHTVRSYLLGSAHYTHISSVKRTYIMLTWVDPLINVLHPVPTVWCRLWHVEHRLPSICSYPMERGGTRLPLPENTVEEDETEVSDCKMEVYSDRF